MTQSLTIRNYHFEWGKRTYLMGILNVTPDSFSDGGNFYSVDNGVKQALKMVDEGADIIDIGGQSTRPGAKQITLEEELNRVIPVIRALRQKSDIPISVDTTRSEVAKEAIASGADIINDISGGTFDREMLPTIAKLNVPIILMHIKGTPETMQSLTDYQDLIGEIKDFLQKQINQATNLGIKKEYIIIDIGIGFAKNYEQNIELLRAINQFKLMNFPLLVGTSRKSFIGKILNQDDPKKRVWGTAASCAYAITQGVDILRVHDVAPMYDIVRVTDAISRRLN
ncbi:dihydropteroate synthase [Cyanobacterium sp. Dongsha4]|uniref:dihydropteroate synthase n=1 Tax=Cyanobacterium sp. DS4 TaxID=2878255 RepID=UPI002E80E199|nr:dihydropteroate synthase [Cyanobacterium sp. Dongsha4]WVK99581.1 dihydropteroate synthase [Cyanobacterium sp. Dongsha4]